MKPSGWPWKGAPLDLTCRLPLGWMKSESPPAVLARNFEKQALRESLVTKPVKFGDGVEGSVMRFLGNQEDKHPGGCNICRWNCEQVFVPRCR